MNISDLLRTSTHTPPQIKKSIFSDIRLECSSFINESANMPIFKNIQTASDPIAPNVFKIKVRHKKTENNVIHQAYNTAFTTNIREKAVFTYSNVALCEQTSDLCYVFPKDGYKFLYSKEISHSNEEYKDVLDTLIESVDIDKAYTIITDMLKFTYTSTNLKEGIQSESEILFYHLPYFYAVSVNRYPNFPELITKIKEAV